MGKEVLDPEEVSRKRRNQEPLAWSKFIVNRPKLAFGKNILLSKLHHIYLLCRYVTCMKSLVMTVSLCKTCIMLGSDCVACSSTCMFEFQ